MGHGLPSRNQRQKEAQERLKRVLSLDPGATTGYAYFEDGKLKECGKMDLEKMLEDFIVNPEDLLVVVESQKIYPHGKKKDNVPDNDIVRVAQRAGELAGFFVAGGAEREYVVPREWKGTVPKEITKKRVLAVLDEEETSLIYSTKSARARTLDHNMIDAVGIGLWRLGRKYRGATK